MECGAREALLDLRKATAVGARRPLLIAHCGGVIAPEAPENSLAAIRLAGSHGYDMVELDVTRPKDDEPVLFHNWTGNLPMNCGVDARLVDHTARELAALRYRASTEPIATLAQALALCRQLRLGVMLDIKARAGSDLTPGFVRRIGVLLEEYALTSAAVTISPHPLVREILAGQAWFPVAEADFHRVALGETSSRRGQFWLGLPEQLPDTVVSALQKVGALVLPAINTFRYPSHGRETLARADIDRLRTAGVDGFQIDSVYGPIFGLGENGADKRAVSRSPADPQL